MTAVLALGLFSILLLLLAIPAAFLEGTAAGRRITEALLRRFG